MKGEVSIYQGDNLVLQKANTIYPIAKFYIASSMGFFPDANYLLNELIITYNNGGEDLLYNLPIGLYGNNGGSAVAFKSTLEINSFNGTITKLQIHNSNLQQDFASLIIPDIVKEPNQSYLLTWQFTFS